MVVERRRVPFARDSMIPVFMVPLSGSGVALGETTVRQKTFRKGRCRELHHPRLL